MDFVVIFWVVVVAVVASVIAIAFEMRDVSEKSSPDDPEHNYEAYLIRARREALVSDVLPELVLLGISPSNAAEQALAYADAVIEAERR